jgi:hypothetical protein
MRPAIVITQPFGVRSKLQELGLDENVLREVAARALSARSQATENHPSNAGGLFMWLEGVCAMRELLAPPPYKWHRESISNLSLTVNEDNTLAIIVAAGDEATGREGVEPCTNSKKGPNTRTAVERNLTLWMFPEMIKHEDILKLKATSGRTTWLFLLHVDATNEEMRCELSQPIEMTENDHVKGWSVRIILPPTSFTGPVRSEVQQSPEIDIKVKKRA